jgi:dipeptidyl aminopeptidase/acylaminoacyl peptidase
MTNTKPALHGSWKSPITADIIVSKAVKLGQIGLDGDRIYWVEMRPEEDGRNVIVCRGPDGETGDVTPEPFNVRTRVHEYGGGAFVVENGVVYFSNFHDQRIYRQIPGSTPESITPEGPFRYADGVLDTARQNLICVREDHAKGHPEAQNTIVRLSLNRNDTSDILVSGSDFYAYPRTNKDGSKLAWLSWNHPNMPWDGTELWVGDLQEDGSLAKTTKIAGGEDESIFQPEWSPDGILYFVSDRTGWWNLHRAQNGQIETVTDRKAEFGLPLWIFGFSTYAFESGERLACTYFEDGSWHLSLLDLKSGHLRPLHLRYSEIEEVRAAPGQVVLKAGAPDQPDSVLRLDLASEEVDVLRRAVSITPSSGYLSKPEAIDFPTENGLAAHGYFYPPRNKDFSTCEGERPPLIVKSHGGPTGATSTTLDLRVQFWTSRGIAILDVNYGGSSCYGREYRLRLDGKWGITDVDDCINGAKYLIEQGFVDPERIAIAGGSAGGYTTLAALTFRDFFAAGASYYGVSDLETLVKDTHKFESRYLDRLIGPYPECQDLYEARSPLHHTEKLACPLILLQGAEDKVVPPNQAEMMFDAVRRKGLPVAYVLFEGEQHGFRKAENIKRSLEAELYFYSKIFGFELAEAVEPVEIHNFE